MGTIKCILCNVFAKQAPAKQAEISIFPPGFVKLLGCRVNLRFPEGIVARRVLVRLVD